MESASPLPSIENPAESHDLGFGSWALSPRTSLRGESRDPSTRCAAERWIPAFAGDAFRYCLSPRTALFLVRATKNLDRTSAMLRLGGPRLLRSTRNDDPGGSISPNLR